MFYYFYRYFLLLCIVCFSSLSFVFANGEEFYTFDVGQGNCQVVLYPRDPSLDIEANEQDYVAVIADCGSKSGRKQGKFNTFRNKWRSICVLNDPVDDNVAPVGIEASPRVQSYHDESLYLSSPDLRTGQDMSFLSPDRVPSSASKFDKSISNSPSQAVTFDNKREVLDLFTHTRITQVVLLVSHPDEDHINFLTPGGIFDELKDIPMCVFLCGDWLGHFSEEGPPRTLTSPVCKALKFLFTRNQEITTVELPHYWDIDDSDEGIDGSDDLVPKHPLYNQLLEELSNFFGDSHTKKLCVDTLTPEVKEALKEYPQRRFCGNFEALQRMSMFYRDNKALYQTQDIPPYIMLNLQVWGMNFPYVDPNKHSMVFSCTLPQNNMSVVMTGDAHHTTFNLIKQFLRTEGKTCTDVIRELVLPQVLSRSALETHLICLTLPHHGSYKNLSKTMRRLFQPDLLVISSGNGASYAHPHKEVIEYWRNLPRSEFYSYYPPQISHGCLAFTDRQGKEPGEYCSTVTASENTGVPIFCTNISGTICINKDSVMCNSSNVFSVEGEGRFLVKWEHNVRTTKGRFFPKSRSRKVNGRSLKYTRVTSVKEASLRAFFYKTKTGPYRYLLAVRTEGKEGPIIKYYVLKKLE